MKGVYLEKFLKKNMDFKIRRFNYFINKTLVIRHVFIINKFMQ